MSWRRPSAFKAIAATALLLLAVWGGVLVQGQSSPLTSDAPVFTGLARFSVTAGITASATQTQGQGQLVSSINEISTVATDGNVVTMPAAVGGQQILIINNGANTVQIYPDTGDDLGDGLNISVELEANEAVTFADYDATNWHVASETEIFHAEMDDSNNTDAFAVSAANNAEVYHTAGMAAGDLAGWTFDAGGGGTTFPIASVADAGGGDITVTTTGSHTLEVGSIISQANLSDAAYEGVFQVLTVPLVTTYTVTAAFTATDTGTMQEAATLACNPSAAGVYFFSWSASATSATNNETMDFEIRADATLVGVPTRRKFSTAADFGSFSGNGIITIAADDKVSFDIFNEDSAGDLTIRNFALSLVRL